MRSKWYGNYVNALLSISFTLEDSMSIYVLGAERRVFSKENLLNYIEGQGMNVETYLDQVNKDEKYIEAQLWISV